MAIDMFPFLVFVNEQDPLESFFSDTIFHEEESEKMSVIPDEIPILPLRNTVLMPNVTLPITVGREKSLRLVRDVEKNKSWIGVVSQKSDVENPGYEHLHTVGTLSKIVRVLRLPNGSTTIIIKGVHRFKIEEFTADEPYFKAKCVLLKDDPVEEKEAAALMINIKETAHQIIQLSPNIPREAERFIAQIQHLSVLTHIIANVLSIPVEDKQKMLETNNLAERAKILLVFLTKELEVLKVANEIHTKVQGDIEQHQRDFYLRQQLKTIQEELGENFAEEEIEKLRERGKKKKWSAKVQEVFEKELNKLSRMNPASPDYTVVQNYIDTLLELPWNEYTKDKFNLKQARLILDKDHFGLEKVKERILEYLAVLKLKSDMKAPILCLYGPPGVGKTSLGASIAKALGRKFVRMSLGGLHDEAEIRGHRRTYIGAMPGRILQNIKKAQSSNPVFILDEIDKINNSFRGDPSSALLEVLDPEQNHSFNDNYVELDYDLSKVLFIATANSLDSIQPALRDRMEVIEINGYTLEEKIQIAQNHLLPRQIKENGLKKSQIKLSDELIAYIIEHHTRESGVRTLNRLIGAMCRYVAKHIAAGEKIHAKLTEEDVIKALGQPRFENDLYYEVDIPGVMVGLAWTPVGGDILFVEVSLSKGTGKLSITGQLGEVMKESANVALAYIRTHAEELKIPHEDFTNYDIHIHVPEGAVPKDGPSAGITMLCALVSAFTKRTARPYVAMTGEITLRGKVLPVGGIKEKILAAKRAGIKEIILCHKNKRDVEEIAPHYLEGLTFHYVETMMQAIELALKKIVIPAPQSKKV
ncbi:MAG: endopeptidase La [Bacteroidia bacterium]|nr:endopeptidase La [Bacteroidia bacterium]MDW8302525.1 endopeptidase La [Bacteroidia bacterium]